MGRQTSRTRVWFGFLFLSTLRFTPRDQSSAHGLPRCTAAFLFPGKDWALTRDAAYDAASLRGWSAATVGVDLKPGGLRPSPPFPLLVRPNRDPIETEPKKGIQSNTIQGWWRRLSHPNPRGVGAEGDRCPSIRHRDEVGKRCGIPPYLRGKRATIHHAREGFEGTNETVVMHVKDVESTKENFKGVRPHRPTVPTDRLQQPPVQGMSKSPCPIPPCPSNSSSEEALSNESTAGTPSEQHQVHGTSRVGFGKGSQPEAGTTHPKRLEPYVCEEVLQTSFEVRNQQTRLLHPPS